MEYSALSNFEQLCAPINSESPTGIDSREDDNDSLYREIRDARKQARDLERKSLFDEEDSNSHQIKPLWETVKAFSIKLLSQNSKDLDVLAWLIEAMTRLDGFAGLSEGFELTAYYLEHYWDGLYPEPDEDGLETKVAAFIGLNGNDGEGTLIQPIRSISLNTESCDIEFVYWQHQQASDIEKISDIDERREREDKLGISVDDIERAVRYSEASDYQKLYNYINSAIEHYQKMTTLFEQHCGHEAPPSSNIKNVLQHVKSCIEELAQNHLALTANTENTISADTPQDLPAENNTTEQQFTQSESLADQAFQSIQNREQALRNLQEIADFFLKTEPHSPISYAVSKAVRWARMPLEELIVELIPEDTDARSSFASITGVTLPRDEDDD